MLFDLDSGMQRFGSVTWLDAHRALGDDGTVIYEFVDDVDRYTRHPHPVLQRILDGAGPGKGWQEGWVDIEDPAREAVDEGRRQDPHEAGKDDSLASVTLHRVPQRCRKGASVRVVAPSHYPSLDTGRRGPVEGSGTVTVRSDKADMGTNISAIEESLEVGTRSRCEYCDVDLWPPRRWRAGV